MSFTENISISFKDNISGYEKPRTVTDSSIKLINKTDKLKEPFNFYLNDQGRLRVYANGFLDATDKSFVNYIDNKIDEFNLYGSNSEFLNPNNYDNNNNFNTSKFKIIDDNAIYIDKN
jgi:hypothetical protein